MNQKIIALARLTDSKHLTAARARALKKVRAAQRAHVTNFDVIRAHALIARAAGDRTVERQLLADE